MKKKVIGKAIYFAVLLSMIPVSAHACVVCAFGLFDYYFPPVKYWMILFSVWFLGTMFLARKTDVSINPLPLRDLTGIIIATTLFVVAGAIAGPILITPLAIWPLLIVKRSMSKKFSAKIDVPTARNLKIFTAIMLVGVIALSIWCREIYKTRTNVDYIIKWEGTAISRSIINKLSREEPYPINDFRKIIEKGSAYVISLFIKSFIKHSDPEIDVPILINALERLHKKVDLYWLDDIQKALCTLTKMQIPNEGKAAQWREAWEKQKKTINISGS